MTKTNLPGCVTNYTCAFFAHKEGPQTLFIYFLVFKLWALYSLSRWTDMIDFRFKSANTDTEVTKSITNAHEHNNCIEAIVLTFSPVNTGTFFHSLDLILPPRLCEQDHSWYLRSFIFSFFFSISYNNTDVTEYIVLQTQSTPPPWLLLLP